MGVCVDAENGCRGGCVDEGNGDKDGMGWWNAEVRLRPY